MDKTKQVNSKEAKQSVLKYIKYILSFSGIGSAQCFGILSLFYYVIITVVVIEDKCGSDT